MLNVDQGKGIAEGALYGAILLVAMKFVARGYIDADMAAYIAAGGVAAARSVRAWWNGRPSELLSRAGEQIPKNTELVITPLPSASHADKQEAVALAESASDKVKAKA